MTVYNVTRLNKPLQKAIATYFEVPHGLVELRYSDWFNAFGAYVKGKDHTNIPREKRKVAAKAIERAMCQAHLDDIAKCPVISRR